jgi:hypothetical protein
MKETIKYWEMQVMMYSQGSTGDDKIDGGGRNNVLIGGGDDILSGEDGKECKDSLLERIAKERSRRITKKNHITI